MGSQVVYGLVQIDTMTAMTIRFCPRPSNQIKQNTKSLAIYTACLQLETRLHWPGRRGRLRRRYRLIAGQLAAKRPMQQRLKQMFRLPLCFALLCA
jgi:hypothetical protein